MPVEESREKVWGLLIEEARKRGAQKAGLEAVALGDAWEGEISSKISVSVPSESVRLKDDRLAPSADLRQPTGEVAETPMSQQGPESDAEVLILRVDELLAQLQDADEIDALQLGEDEWGLLERAIQEGLITVHAETDEPYIIEPQVEDGPEVDFAEG